MSGWLSRHKADVAHGQTACLVSLNDMADRQPRILADGEAIDLGAGRRTLGTWEGRDTMKFGLCYIPDYHEELSGSWHDWYEGMIAEVKLAERLGFHGAWFAEHRVPGFAFGSPAMFIAACARETGRIRLGCSVSLL